jgi:hypothetical protein
VGSRPAGAQGLLPSLVVQGRFGRWRKASVSGYFRDVSQSPPEVRLVRRSDPAIQSRR